MNGEEKKTTADKTGAEKEEIKEKPKTGYCSPLIRTRPKKKRNFCADRLERKHEEKIYTPQ